VEVIDIYGLHRVDPKVPIEDTVGAMKKLVDQGKVLISLVPELSGIHIPVSWVSVVLAFLVSCSTGVLFGYLPANRAARLHPTESLRYE